MTPRDNKPVKIIVHTTDASYNQVNPQFLAVNRWHKERWSDFQSSLGFWVGYHKLIEKDGTVMTAREDDEQGAHTVGQNSQSIGICLAFDGDVEMPTEAQVTSLKREINHYIKKYNIPLSKENILPHRHFAPGKTCPGSLLADDWAYNLIVQEKKDSEGLTKNFQTQISKRQLDKLNAKLIRLKRKLSKLLKKK